MEPVTTSAACETCGRPMSEHAMTEDGPSCLTDLGFPIVGGDVILTHDPIKQAGGYY